MPMERELQELGTQDTSKDAPIGGGRARRPAAPRLSSWPFLLIDGTILFTAAAILNTAERPLPLSTGALIALLVVIGGAVALFPFWRAYRNELKFAELEAVEETVRRIEGLSTVADRVERAESSWLEAKNSSETIAKNLNETTTALYEESKAIREFAHQQNDQQKANLRLEVQKLKQWETEWVQAGTIALDHTAALHAAILQLEDAQATRKLNKFQNSIHEIMRRVGLVGFAPRPGAPPACASLVFNVRELGVPRVGKAVSVRTWSVPAAEIAARRAAMSASTVARAATPVYGAAGVLSIM